jgi:hypothetical protein
MGTLRDVETALAASRRTNAPLQLFLLSHSRAKLRYGWAPAVSLRCLGTHHEGLPVQRLGVVSTEGSRATGTR